MQETQVQSLHWEHPLEKGVCPTPVFVPGEFHGQRRLVSYSPQGHRESDTTEQLAVYFIAQASGRRLQSMNTTKGGSPGSIVRVVCQCVSTCLKLELLWSNLLSSCLLNGHSNLSLFKASF